MNNSPKVKSVTELSKYKIDDILYWVVFRPVKVPTKEITEEWMLQYHPKILHDRKITDRIWGPKNKLPKLCSLDFEYVIETITSEPIVEKFVIASVYRSLDTGEFYYANDLREWMPQAYLFTTKQKAVAEKIRIKQMFAKWAASLSPDEA